MAKTKLVTFIGTGQRNGLVTINKTVEYEEHIARSFQGPQSDKAITDVLAVHYPGVAINPRRISISISDSIVSRKPKPRRVSKEKNTSLFAPPFWMIPFRLLWRMTIGLFKFIINLLMKD